MPYALGAVKPHVKAAGEQLGARFGIRTMYGFVAKPGDHGKGLALDCMITNLDNGRAIGDALAAYAIANAAALGITYVIWYKRIWSVARASEGWRVYDYKKLNESDHTDHVHLSFAATPGSGGLELVDLPYGASTVGVTDTAGQLVDLFKTINGTFEKLSRREMWIRAGFFIAGFWLCMFALLRLSGAEGKATEAAQMFIGSKMKGVSSG